MNGHTKTLLLLASLTGLILLIGAMLGGRGGVMMAFLFALAMNVGSYWFSDKIVLRMYRAQDLSPAEAPLIYQIVGELAQNANLPMPRIVLVPEQAPNAFATGRDPEHAVVAVTEGLLNILNPEEVKGVLGHEMAHVAHRDILIQTIAGVMATTITYLAYSLQFGAMFGGRGGDGERSNPLALIAMAVLAPIAASIIQMTISRQREYLADEWGAQFARSPQSLANALKKLGTYSGQIPMQTGTQSTANMFIVQPLYPGRSMASLMSTHPPLEERIARLEHMQMTGQYPTEDTI